MLRVRPFSKLAKPRKMPRVSPNSVTSAFRRGIKTIRDLELLKVLQSEIAHELSSNHFQNDQNGSLGDFVVDWDSPNSKDVVLRRKCSSGEEVAISAILGPPTSDRDGVFPREVFMKVCIKKPSLSSILHFDCQVVEESDTKSNFNITRASYLHSPTSLGSSTYRGPPFSDLDPELQDALKEYLTARGIGENLTSFLLHYLHKGEQEQYVKWLQKVESFLAKSE